MPCQYPGELAENRRWEGCRLLEKLFGPHFHERRQPRHVAPGYVELEICDDLPRAFIDTEKAMLAHHDAQDIMAFDRAMIELPASFQHRFQDDPGLGRVGGSIESLEFCRSMTGNDPVEDASLLNFPVGVANQRVGTKIQQACDGIDLILAGA